MTLHSDVPAGLPAQNDTTFCPAGLPSCYIYMSAAKYDRATTRCAALGGVIVSYSDAAEQLLVEKFFTVGAAATSHCRLMLVGLAGRC